MFLSTGHRYASFYLGMYLRKRQGHWGRVEDMEEETGRVDRAMHLEYQCQLFITKNKCKSVKFHRTDKKPNPSEI